MHRPSTTNIDREVDEAEAVAEVVGDVAHERRARAAELGLVVASERRTRRSEPSPIGRTTEAVGRREAQGRRLPSGRRRRSSSSRRRGERRRPARRPGDAELDRSRVQAVRVDSPSGAGTVGKPCTSRRELDQHAADVGQRRAVAVVRSLLGRQRAHLDVQSCGDSVLICAEVERQALLRRPESRGPCS